MCTVHLVGRTIALFSAIVAFAFLPSENSCAQKVYRVPEAVTQVSNGITVCVNPQVELISIIQTIGKYPSRLGFLMSKDSSAYKTDVENHFSYYKNHRAVKMFDRLSSQPRMLNFSAPSNVILYTDEHLNLRGNIVPDDFVVDRAGGGDSLVVLLGLLRDFADQSSFNDFFQNHRDYYLKIIENTVKNLGTRDYISELEDFYGLRQKSYNVVLVSLYSFNGFGNSLLCSDGSLEIYNTMGPQRVKEGIPFFGNENYLKYMVRHEFSHPFINPLTEKYWDYIKLYSSNYDSIPENAKDQVCGDWQECINEFVIRAATTHLAYNESDETGGWAYNKEKSRGVYCLDSLLCRMKYYQLNRETYQTVDSYYTKLLDVFKER